MREIDRIRESKAMTLGDKHLEIMMKVVDAPFGVDRVKYQEELMKEYEELEDRLYPKLKILKDEHKKFMEQRRRPQRIIREGCTTFCNKCGSTAPRKHFGLFGGKICDNEYCENSNKN